MVDQRAGGGRAGGQRYREERHRPGCFCILSHFSGGAGGYQRIHAHRKERAEENKLEEVQVSAGGAAGKGEREILAF